METDCSFVRRCRLDSQSLHHTAMMTRYRRVCHTRTHCQYTLHTHTQLQPSDDADGPARRAASRPISWTLSVIHTPVSQTQTRFAVTYKPTNHTYSTDWCCALKSRENTLTQRPRRKKRLDVGMLGVIRAGFKGGQWGPGPRPHTNRGPPTKPFIFFSFVISECVTACDTTT